MLQFSHTALIFFQKVGREKKEKSLRGHNEKCVCVFRTLEFEIIQDGRNISLHYIYVIIIIFTSKAFSGYIVLIWASMHVIAGEGFVFQS